MAEIIFIFCKLGDGWLKLYLFPANHLYLVNKDYFFIILMYHEKTNVVSNNQNSLERAILMNTHGLCLYRELKKVNISTIKYPLFSVSLKTLLDNIKVINLFCSV